MREKKHHLFNWFCAFVFCLPCFAQTAAICDEFDENIAKLPKLMDLLPTATPEQAQHVFETLAKRPDFACYGMYCETRAHIIAKDFEERYGVRASKIWASSRTGVMLDLNRSGTTRAFFGNVHVAALVDVHTDHGDVPMVIDHALFDHPVTLDEWKSRIHGDNIVYTPTDRHALNSFGARLPDQREEILNRMRRNVQSASSEADVYRLKREFNRRSDELHGKNPEFRKAMDHPWFSNWWERNALQYPNVFENWSDVWRTIKTVSEQTEMLKRTHPAFAQRVESGPFFLDWYSLDRGPALWAAWGIKF